MGDGGAEGELQGNLILWNGGNSSLPSSVSRIKAVFSLGTAMVLRRVLLPAPEGRALSMAVASSIEAGIQSIAVGGSVVCHFTFGMKQSRMKMTSERLCWQRWCPGLQQRRSRAFVHSTSMAEQRWLNEAA